MRPETGKIAASDDLELARRSAGGDRAAQRKLFEAQKARVHWIAFRVLGSNRETEDLIQEALVSVFRSLASYRGEASLNTWVDRITTRTAFRYLSRRPPRPVHLEVVAKEPEADGPRPDEHAYHRQAIRRLYAILDQLAPKYRLAFVLHVIDDRPIGEVAALTEVSLIAAKNRVWRARRMLERRAHADPVLRALLNEWKGQR